MGAIINKRESASRQFLFFLPNSLSDSGLLIRGLEDTSCRNRNALTRFAPVKRDRATSIAATGALAIREWSRVRAARAAAAIPIAAPETLNAE